MWKNVLLRFGAVASTPTASERALQGLIAAKDAYLELAKSPAREQETQSRSQQPATLFEESKKS